MRGLTIGRLAREAGVNVETVRYYQRLGLIQEPPKPLQGYRCYPPETVVRLRFIKRAQDLGFTLKEIAELLSLGDGHCREVQALARQKLERIRARQRDLEAMAGALEDLLARCEAGAKDTGCALVEALARGADGGRTPATKKADPRGAADD